MKAEGEVNYCPNCETVLANEQVIENKCERCNTEIRLKTLNQWYFRITKYKDRLIKNLESIDYPEHTKKRQLHWLENLRDWCVSRQRKWGCPIPIEGEPDTLDTFVDSSFYTIRYCDPNNNTQLVDFNKAKQVDVYVGGNEHACMHLIYARFITMFLYDIGVVPFEEPFKKVVHQGMILNKGEKMSKSKGNTIDTSQYNPNILRMYLMFINHYFEGGSWSDQNIKGIERFYAKITRWFSEEGEDTIDISKFRESIINYFNSWKTNKVISEWMIFYNANKSKKLSKAAIAELKPLWQIICPE